MHRKTEATIKREIYKGNSGGRERRKQSLTRRTTQNLNT